MKNVIKMIRKLDDTRVGEYKVGWGWTFVYTIFIVIRQ